MRVGFTCRAVGECWFRNDEPTLRHRSPGETTPPRLIGMTDLMAGPPPTHLPEDPAAAELARGRTPAAVVRRHPASPIAWAALAALAAEAAPTT